MLLGVCPFELLRHCGLCAAGQLIVCSHLWAPLQEFLPKVAEASQKGLLLAWADCSQLLRCEALGEWHEEELPQAAAWQQNEACETTCQRLSSAPIWLRWA